MEVLDRGRWIGAEGEEMPLDALDRFFVLRDTLHGAGG